MICIGLLLFSEYIYPKLDVIFMRLSSEGMSIRTIKNTLAMGVILENYQNLLIGADVLYYSTVKVGVVGISDNSFLAIGLKFGLVYLVFTIFIMVLLIKSTVNLNSKSLFLLIYFAGNLYLTNAIYWDLYLLYFFSVLYVVAPINIKSAATINN